MITIGIDPGLSGAIAVLKDGKFVSVHDMPTTLRGAGSVKMEVNPAALKQIIKSSVPPDDDVTVILEKVSAMPGQGVSSMFSLGDSFGVCRAVTSCCGYRLILETPQKWKKYFELGGDKEKSRALTTRLFPDAPLTLKKHSDRAEAILLAYYLWKKDYE